MVQNLGDDMESQKSSRHFDISISEQPDMQYASYSNEELSSSQVSEIVDRKTIKIKRLSGV